MDVFKKKRIISMERTGRFKAIIRYSNGTEEEIKLINWPE